DWCNVSIMCSRAMKVLGVDPGLTRCGVAVVSGSPGRSLQLDGVGVVRSRTDDDLAVRLLALEEGLNDWLAEHRPDVVAVERVFSQHNVRTVMGTAQASGVAMLSAARQGIASLSTRPAKSKPP